MEDIDLQILKELNRNGRISFRKIAQKLGVATGTVQNRIERMTENGIIKNFKASIDYEKVGYAVSAIIGMTFSDRSQHLKIENELSKCKNVVSIYAVTGDFDIILTARFKTMGELNTFVTKDLGSFPIGKSNTFLVLETIKDETSLM